MKNSASMSKQSDTDFNMDTINKVYMNTMNNAQKQFGNVCVLGGIFTNSSKIAPGGCHTHFKGGT